MSNAEAQALSNELLFGGWEPQDWLSVGQALQAEVTVSAFELTEFATSDLPPIKTRSTIENLETRQTMMTT
eukprot:SAG31_NODE_6380_length_2039_cov_2.167526_1_plen_71_part_00